MRGIGPQDFESCKYPQGQNILSSHVVPDVSNNLSQHIKINLDGNDSVKGDVKPLLSIE